MRWQLVDQIDELIPGERALGTRRWDPSLPLFQDHFPTFAVVPGVLTMESLAQLAGKLIGLSVRVARGDWPFPILSMMDRVKFRKFVRPNELVHMEARLKSLRDESAYVDVFARVDGKTVAQAEQFFVFNAVPLASEADRAAVEATERAELQRLWAGYPGPGVKEGA